MESEKESTKINDENLAIATFLKACVNFIYSNYDVNMCLYIPGFQPLSIIKKNAKEILTELHNNLLIILKRYANGEEISLSPYAFESFFGYEKEELKKRSCWILAMQLLKGNNKITDYPDAYVELPKFIEYTDMSLNFIIQSMLLSYAEEFQILYQDFKDYKVTTTSDGTTITSISTPQSAATFFRIMCGNKVGNYCSIADAVLDNQKTKCR